MSALEDVMNDILKNTNRLARHKFTEYNHNVTNHLLHLPTTNVLQREAQPHETRLFAISSGEAQCRFHADLIKEMQDIKNGTSRKDANRLLAIASDLNKLSNDASVEKRITQMNQKYQQYQAILDYKATVPKQSQNTQDIQELEHIKNTLAEKEQRLIQMESKCTAMDNTMNERRNKVEYAKALVKEKQRLLLLKQAEQQRQSQAKTWNTNNDHAQSDKRNVKDPHPQLKKIEQLKKTIAIEKSKLNSASSPSTAQSSSSSTSTSTSKSESTSASTPTPTSHSAQAIFDLLQNLKTNKAQRIIVPDNEKKGTSSEETISIMDQIIQTLQKMTARYGRRQELEDELDKMNHLRQQIVTKTDQEIQDVIDKSKSGDQNAGQEILMAMILVILHQHNGKILFDDLTNKITDYATHLGLGSSHGSDAIYSWIGKEVFTIDRSQVDSIVLLNWK